MFVLGRYYLGVYVARSLIASAYGPSSALVAMLLWVYYSVQTFLVGAEILDLVERPTVLHLAIRGDQEAVVVDLGERTLQREFDEQETVRSGEIRDQARSVERRTPYHSEHREAHIDDRVRGISDQELPKASAG